MPASRQPHNRKASLVLSGVSAPSSAPWPAVNRKPRLECLQRGMGFGSTFDKRGFCPGRGHRVEPDGETPLSKYAATPGTGAVLVLSGVSGLGQAVGYSMPEKPRLEHLRQGSGIAAPGPLSGYEAGLLGPGGHRKATGCNREAWGREITTINYTNTCAIILEECYQVAANMKQ